MSADRNLLFGILALQNNFISREQLIEAMNAWTLDRRRSLEDILREKNALSPEKQAVLNTLVAMQLQQHEGDVEKSIQAMGVSSLKRETLTNLIDGDLKQSLSSLTDDFLQNREEGAAGVAPREESRFRVIRLHARGGLGEVYVAEDLELHREVALKVIQAKHADNDMNRGRFVQEAEITGRLEHPNIVPVYGLGTYDDGGPFYAMRFIRGDSLKEAIDRFFNTAHDSLAAKNLAFRNMLKRFMDVCDAIAYAHSRGILHRDLKPGNIMLGKYGETLVVDWGLAKSLGSRKTRETAEKTDEHTLVPRSMSSCAETQDDSIVGTPAYMPPEQARGRQDELGLASDVYSLGATLYVLLTGKAPFSGGPSEIIRKVMAGDFPRPREVNPAAPAALEAVTLKAMAIRPEDRYPTATALGREIERYLGDEPVQAHVEPISVRAKRWLRRHPGIVSAVAATVLVGVAALGTGLYMVNTEKNRTEEARGKAVRALGQAERSEQAAVTARDQAFQALRSMTDELVERKFAAGQGTRLTEDDKLFMRGVIRQYDAFASTQADDAESLMLRAEGRARVALMRFRLGDLKDAEEDWKAALDILKKLVEEAPTNPEYRRELAMSHNNRGNLLIQTGRQKEGEQDWDRAREIRKQLVEEFPQSPEYRRDLAMSHNNLGGLLSQTGRIKESEPNLNKAQEIQKQLVEEFPSRPEFRKDLAMTLNNRGALRRGMGRLKEAEEDWDTALRIYEALAKEFPKNPEYRRDLAMSHSNRGILMNDTGRPKEAEQDWARALDIRTHLVAEYPTRSEFRKDLATSHNNRGILLSATGRLKEAEQDWDSALRIYRQLASEFPTRSDIRMELAMGLNNRGGVYYDTGRLKEAEEDWKNALEVRRKLVAEFPSRPECRQDLAKVHNNLGVLQMDMGRFPDAEQNHTDALEIRRKLAAEFSTNPEFRRDLALSHNNRGNLFRDTDRLAEAELDYGAAIEIYRQLALEFPTRVDIRQDLARSHHNRGNLFQDTGRLKEAELDHKAALAIRGQLASQFPDQPDTRNQMGESLLNLAAIHEKSGDWAGARQRLLESQPHHLAALKANTRNPKYRQAYLRHLEHSIAVLARLLENEEAVRLAKTRSDLAWNPPGDAYNAACYLSKCIPLLAEQDNLTEAKKKEAMKFYGDEAMKLLREAVNRGYNDQANMRKDEDLDPLRDRKDFQALMQEQEREKK